MRWGDLGWGEINQPKTLKETVWNKLSFHFLTLLLLLLLLFFFWFFILAEWWSAMSPSSWTAVSLLWVFQFNLTSTCDDNKTSPGKTAPAWNHRPQFHPSHVTGGGGGSFEARLFLLIYTCLLHRNNMKQAKECALDNRRSSAAFCGLWSGETSFPKNNLHAAAANIA